MPKMTSEPSPATSLWRHRDFVLLWSGGAVSDLGSAVSTLVLPLIAVQHHASIFQVSLLGVMGRGVPFLLLSLPAGVLVDRVDRRTLMIWSDLGRMAAIASIPVVSLLGEPVSMTQLVLAALVVGSLRVVFDVADQSYLPALLPSESLVDANGKLRAAETFADSVGPSLGALLSGLVGAARAIGADSLSFAASVGSLLLIRSREPRPEPGAGPPRVGFRTAMNQGLRFVFQDAILRRIALATATANTGIALVTAIEVVFLVRSVHSSPTQIGLVLGLGTLGGVGGSLLARRLARALGSARVMWVALVVPAPLVFLMPLAQSGWGVLTYAAGWAAFNASGGVYNTASLSYRQSVCPPEMRGRMNASIRWLIFGVSPVGALLGGGLGTWFGLRPALWVGASVMALTGLWLVASPLRGMRDIPLPETS
jgi:MFS family permease